MKPTVKNTIAMAMTVLVLATSSEVNADPLYDAVQEGKLEEVKQLIEKGASVDTPGMFGHPPLVHATSCGHTIIAEYLISKGADIDGRDRDGCTPLQTAAFWGNYEIAAILVAKGADVKSRDKIGLSPLHAAAGGCNPKDFGMSMMAIALRGDKDKVEQSRRIAELLVSKDADINAKDNNEYTPLHWAATQGREVMVRFLIAGGAEVNARTKGSFFKKGKTPLQMAIEEEQHEIAELLKEHGAK